MWLSHFQYVATHIFLYSLRISNIEYFGKLHHIYLTASYSNKLLYNVLAFRNVV